MAIDSPIVLTTAPSTHPPRGGGDPDKTTAASQHCAVPRLQAELLLFWGYHRTIFQQPMEFMVIYHEKPRIHQVICVNLAISRGRHFVIMCVIAANKNLTISPSNMVA